MRTEFVCISVLRVASGSRVGLAGPPGGLLCWPFWGGGPGVGLTLCCFVVYSTGRFVVCLSVCHFFLVFFGPFSVAIASFGERGASLSAFRTFVRFVLVWICRFPLPLGVLEGLRFVIVALPGLFSYHFLLISSLKCISCVLIRIAPASTLNKPYFIKKKKKIEKTSLNYLHLPPDQALSCSNFPCLEHISMIQKMFEI